MTDLDDIPRSARFLQVVLLESRDLVLQFRLSRDKSSGKGREPNAGKAAPQEFDDKGNVPEPRPPSSWP